MPVDALQRAKGLKMVLHRSLAFDGEAEWLVTKSQTTLRMTFKAYVHAVLQMDNALLLYSRFKSANYIE